MRIDTRVPQIIAAAEEQFGIDVSLAIVEERGRLIVESDQVVPARA